MPAPRQVGKNVLPWLSLPAMALCLAVVTGLFLLVDTPPLVDVPGHIGAAAIEAAPPGSALRSYYQWHWAFIPNMGGEVLLKLLARPFGVLAAGWWTTLIATLGLVLGAMATIRSLNPKGAFALGWAMIFVFGFPWIWGFLNFILATGLSLLVFAAAIRLQPNPRARAAVLLVAQPIVMLCHAVGGLILPLVVAAESLGAALDDAYARKETLGSLATRVARKCWPLAATPLFIVIWKAQAPPPASPGMEWDWLGKADFLLEALRDQSFLLDIGSVVTGYLLVVAAYVLGARWTWRQGLPALAIFLVYIAMPSRLNGSQAVDTRLLPVAMLLALGLLDWSQASTRTARFILLSGAVLFMARMAMIAISFSSYQTEYRIQLKALDHVSPGSRVLVYYTQSCSDALWRMSRLDTLGALASVQKQAWVNTQWTIPGLDMLQSNFDPAPGKPDTVAGAVWDSRCPDADGRSLDEVLQQAPIGKVDYLWLLDTGMPLRPPPGLQLQWQAKRSALFRVGR